MAQGAPWHRKEIGSFRFAANALELKKFPLWACSSAGRAPALQAGGREFESPHVHQPSVRKINHLLIRPLNNFTRFGNIWEQLTL
jgi:hypothetical protein